MCVPPKIGDAIVFWIAVIMTTFHVLWTRSLESCQYQNVYLNVMSLAVDIKCYSQSATSVLSWNESYPIVLWTRRCYSECRPIAYSAKVSDSGECHSTLTKQANVSSLLLVVQTTSKSKGINV